MAKVHYINLCVKKHHTITYTSTVYYILANLNSKLDHLGPEQSRALKELITEFSDLFPDFPGRARGVYHGIDVGEARPMKQHPYRTGPAKAEILDREVEYMLANNIIEPSNSPWSSPCTPSPSQMVLLGL